MFNLLRFIATAEMFEKCSKNLEIPRVNVEKLFRGESRVQFVETSELILEFLKKIVTLSCT